MHDVPHSARLQATEAMGWREQWSYDPVQRPSLFADRWLWQLTMQPSPWHFAAQSACATSLGPGLPDLEVIGSMR